MIIDTGMSCHSHGGIMVTKDFMVITASDHGHGRIRVRVCVQTAVTFPPPKIEYRISNMICVQVWETGSFDAGGECYATIQDNGMFVVMAGADPTVAGNVLWSSNQGVRCNCDAIHGAAEHILPSVGDAHFLDWLVVFFVRGSAGRHVCLFLKREWGGEER